MIALEALGEGRVLAPDPDLDRYALRFEPAEERPVVVWHGPTRFVRDGATAPPLPSPEPAVAGLAGHYRSHDPWETNYRVILRGDVPWLVFAAAPDGFEPQQPLVSRPDGSFRVGDDPGGPEDLRFDTVVNGPPAARLVVRLPVLPRGVKGPAVTDRRRAQAPGPAAHFVSGTTCRGPQKAPDLSTAAAPEGS